ncbi:MAG: hypothetical protein IJA12_08210 [Oscillospiraceae bacterium]|nr:hypothetical protein [Oscillospiraceae bacterium]
MFKGKYKIADKVVEINSIYIQVQDLCADYSCDDNADFSVTVSQSDIDFERDKSAAEDIKEGIPTRVFSDSYLETLAVYRQITEHLLDDDVLLFHGSVIAVDGEGFLFTAKSGTGKSTHTRLWRKFFGERAFMVNDDKPLIRLTDNGAVVYGTPWDGKHRLSTNTSVPLRAICILERSAENHINKITRKDAYAMLMQQTHRPGNAVKMAKTLTLIDRLGENVSLYRLGCNMDISAAEVAYNGMKG